MKKEKELSVVKVFITTYTTETADMKGFINISARVNQNDAHYLAEKELNYHCQSEFPFI